MSLGVNMPGGYGPRHPLPFPDGAKVRLSVCPRCRMKHMPYWFAPYDRAYRTRCQNCGVDAVVHPKDFSPGELQRRGGFTPSRAKQTDDGVFDGTKLYEESRDIHDLGIRRALRKGAINPTGRDLE